MNQLEKITPQFVENLLKLWRSGAFSTEDLTALNFQLEGGNSLEEQKIALREMLYQRVYAHLPDLFRDELASQNSRAILAALSKSFQGQISDPQYFALIYLRYLALQKYSVQTLAESINVTPRTLRRYLSKGLERFSIQLKTERKRSDCAYAGKSLQDFFPTVARQETVGIEPVLGKINAWLESDSPPYAISIEGIGGIGKTLVAQYLLQDQFEQHSFENYAWVSAAQKEISLGGEIRRAENFASTLDDVVARLAHQFGQSHLAGLSTKDKLKGIKKITKKNRFLMIIDNLETLDDVDHLVPELLQLAGKSKLLFTSRKSLRQYPAIQTFSIPELSLEDSYTLVKGELRRRGENLSLSDEMISTLYQTIGGIPLVLKLAAAQFGFLPAEEILNRLRSGEANAQNMYTYIYRQAWLLLDDTAKNLLLSMLLVSPEGEDRQWICEMGNLSFDEFEKGLRQLKRLSLIEFFGSISSPLYRIHRLTATFLQTDILQDWEKC